MTETTTAMSGKRRTVWTLSAEISRVVSTAVTLLFAARSLGPAHYGKFAGALALVMLAAPIANLGSPLLMLQRVAHRGLSARSAFGTALGMTLVGGCVTGVVLLGLTVTAFSQLSVQLVLILCVSEYICAGSVQTCSGLALASNDYKLHSTVITISGACRSTAAVLFVAIHGVSVIAFAGMYASASVVGAGLSLCLTHMRLRLPIRPRRFSRRDVKDGFPYSASIAAFGANDGVDKPLLTKFGWQVDSGLYAAAYRVPALALIPIQAVVLATLNRSFEAGRSGVGAVLRASRRVVAPCIAYSIAAAAALYVAAPLARPILGDEFSGSVTIVRWLCFLPILRTVQLLPGNALMGAGRQSLRLRLVVIVTVVNAATCLALIPRHSWRGAALATLVSESTYAVLLWATVIIVVKRERRGTAGRGPLTPAPVIDTVPQVALGGNVG